MDRAAGGPLGCSGGAVFDLLLKGGRTPMALLWNQAYREGSPPGVGDFVKRQVRGSRFRDHG
jgi:hypothetical protein